MENRSVSTGRDWLWNETTKREPFIYLNNFPIISINEMADNVLKNKKETLWTIMLEKASHL